MKSKLLPLLGAVLVPALFVSGCSQSDGASQMSGSQMQEEMVAPATTKSADEHTHPANKCTNSINHTHPNGSGEHKHRYSCKDNANKAAGAHTHPANKCTRSVTHSHPNGQGEHKHRYSCKSNAADANSHIHPANSKTRSTRHTHPNGKRKHTHKYGG